MSAGRHWIRELYVGFLLLILSFLYLSHLTDEIHRAEVKKAVNSVKRNGLPVASAGMVQKIFSTQRLLL